MRKSLYYKRAARLFLAGSRFNSPCQMVLAGKKTLEEWVDVLQVERDLEEANKIWQKPKVKRSSYVASSAIIS